MRAVQLTWVSLLVVFALMTISYSISGPLYTQNNNRYRELSFRNVHKSGNRGGRIVDNNGGQLLHPNLVNNQSPVSSTSKESSKRAKIRSILYSLSVNTLISMDKSTISIWQSTKSARQTVSALYAKYIYDQIMPQGTQDNKNKHIYEINDLHYSFFNDHHNDEFNENNDTCTTSIRHDDRMCTYRGHKYEKQQQTARPNWTTSKVNSPGALAVLLLLLAFL